MITARFQHSLQRRQTFAGAAIVLTAPWIIGATVIPARAGPSAGPDPGPTLAGRAVLPVSTLAPGPPSGGSVLPGAGTRNGITFPLPSQPVEGFSAIVAGRHAGEYLAMPDNGFGAKATSTDFLNPRVLHSAALQDRRRWLGRGPVGDFISFRDPDHLIGFPIVTKASQGACLPAATSTLSRCSAVATESFGWAMSSGLGFCTSTVRAVCSILRSRCPAGSCRPTTRS